MKPLKILLHFLVLFNTTLFFGQYISKQQALEDLQQFRELLEKESSYIHISDYSYETDFQHLKKEIEGADSIPKSKLLQQISTIVYQIGDRHSKVKLEEKEWFFPFFVANHTNKFLAIKKNRKTYSLYDQAYPYLKKINGIPILDYLKKYDTRNTKAPKTALISKGAEALNFYGESLKLNNEPIDTLITVTLGNEISEKDFSLQLRPYSGRYKSVARLRDTFEDALEEKSFQKLSYWIDKDIAYTALPEMYSFRRNPKLQEHLTNTMQKFREAKNLIIDIRYNPGGVRDILAFLAPYFIQKKESPWVANVAYLRTDREDLKEVASMNSRYLHLEESKHFNDTEKGAITAFQKNFQPTKKFDHSKFSKPFYMVFSQGETPFKGSVYILMNENCFSAASVFAASLKGLEKVTLVGTTTDGSSGRSRRFQLVHSGISIKISTMLSFQRDGNPLDGYGTMPDIVITPDLEMILNKKDTQLKRLLTLIKNK